MSKSGKRDNPNKYYCADYGGWRWYVGGHWLKQDEKCATKRTFRRIGKDKCDNGLFDYLEEEYIKENDDGSAYFTWLTSDKEWADYWWQNYNKVIYDESYYKSDEINERQESKIKEVV